jgi:predicted MFS family arabinose efflux permease
MTETTPISPFNRKSILGFIAAIISLLALCVGLLPVPFTILLCYPPGIILGIAALVLGIQAQREIRQSNENGRMLALISAWVGGLTIIATLCIVTAGVLLYPYISKFIQQLWQQIKTS